MPLRYAKAEDIIYSIANEKQFKYLITRLHKDEQKAFEEIGERIRNSADKKITKREIQEIFKKHVESAYHGELINLNDRLTDVLRDFVERDFVDDGGLKVEVAEPKLTISKTGLKKLRAGEPELAISKVGLKKVGDIFQGSETFGGTKMDITLSMKGEKLLMDVELKNPTGTAKSTYVLQIREVEGWGLHAEGLHGEWKSDYTPGMRPYVWEIIRDDPYYIFNGHSSGHGLLDNRELAEWVKGHLKKLPEPLK